MLKTYFYKLIIMAALCCCNTYAATAGSRLWSDEECQRIINAVTNPGKIDLVSKKHPKEELTALGIADKVRQFSGDPEKLRHELACELFERAPAGFDFLAKFQARSCPESAFVACMDYLLDQKSALLPQVIAARYSTGSTNNVSGYFLGCMHVRYGAAPDYKAAGQHFAAFLVWHGRSGSSLAKLFGDRELSRSHAAYALYCQRVPQKTGDVEKHLLRAEQLFPSGVNAHNLADWYTAQQKLEEAAKYKAIALQREQTSGIQSQVDSVVSALQMSGGRVLPVGEADAAISEATVRAQANARIYADPEFAAAVARGILSAKSSLNPQAFSLLSARIETLQQEISFANTWPTLLEKQEALRRIAERLPVFRADPRLPELIVDISELFPKFTNECHAELQELQNVLRDLITQMARENSRGRLVSAHFSGIAGLAEEVTFIEAFIRGIHEQAQPIAVRLTSDTNAEQIVELNPLHCELLTQKQRNQGKPPRNVLQILRSSGVTEASDLYRYWQAIYQRTWAVEQVIARETAIRNAQAEHEAFWSGQPTAVRAGKARVRRAGTALVAGDTADSDEEESLPQSGYSPTAVFAEAERMAHMPEHAVPEAVRSLLRLEVTPGASGSMTLVTLYQTNSDKTETELSRWHPHRAHQKVWDFDAEATTNFLWNLHKLQQQDK